MDKKQDTQITLCLLDFLRPAGCNNDPLYYLEKVEGNRVFLEIFLDRLSHLKSIHHSIALVQESVLPKVKPFLDKYATIQVKVIPDDIDAFLPYHNKILKARKWSYLSFSGGLNEYTFFDEIFPIEILQQFSQQVVCDAVLYLNPQMPFFSTKKTQYLLDKIFEMNNSNPKLPFVVYPDAIGKSPLIITKHGLGLIKTSKIGPVHGFRQAPNLIIETAIRNILGLEVNIYYERMSYRLNSNRMVKFLRKAYLDNKVSGLIDIKASSNSILDGFIETPIEVDIELTSDNYGISFDIPNLNYKERVEMEISLFEKIIQQLSNIEGVLLTIGTRYNISTHSRPEEIIKIIRSNSVYGLQLVWDGCDLVDKFELLEFYLELDIDILVINMTLLLKNRVNQYHYFEECLVKILKNRKAPLVHLELNKREDNWLQAVMLNDLQKKYHISFNIIPYNHYASQLPKSKNMASYLPRHRYACEKLLYSMYILPDGRAPVCKEDIYSHMGGGNANHQSILDIWNQLEVRSKRAKHLKGIFNESQLCKSCENWIHT